MMFFRHNTPVRALGLGLTLATGLVVPSFAQDADPGPPGAAAVARLDFPAALEDLGKAIEADPDAPAPRLARAALHLKMQRPALALADLDAVLAADPANVPALLARAAIWDAQRAWNRARADLDAALATAPDNLAALTARARVNARAGLIAAAQADYDTALALAPDDTALADARAALGASQAERRANAITFAPEAVMAEAFVVNEGAAAAPDTLHFVHAATDLAQDYAGIDRAALDRAVDTGALRIVHLFTYTGRDASIWGNLALICAGTQGLAATHAALSQTSAQDALAAAEAGDFTALESLLGEVYAQAGVDPKRVRTCALDRGQATRYLADWRAHRDADAWRGVNLLDHWPVWVLNGTSVGPETLAAHLAEIAPAPEPGPGPSGDDAAAATDLPAPDMAGDDTNPAQTASQTETDAPAPQTAPEGPDEAPVAEADRSAAALPATGEDAALEKVAADRAAPVAGATEPRAPLFPTRPEPVGDLRVPVELRGVYAPTLAACLAYLDSIEAPARIDAVLPAMNPLDGPVLGTILVTSRRVYLFNPLDTECAIAGEDRGAAGGWQGDFACTSPLSPNAATGLKLAPASPDGTAPRISAAFGGRAPVILRQCRALGQLGRAFAPLWTGDGAGCSVAVPVGQGRFNFFVDAGGKLVLRVAPSTIPGGAGAKLLHAVIDGERVSPAGGRWDGTGWQISFGPFDAAAERLGWGMFLDVRTSGAGFEARLPLFGSSAAMRTLAGCALGND